MDINLILKQLEMVEEALKCNTCFKKCVDPIKIKVCGHYFCYNCLEMKDHLCPVCKKYYEEKELDYDNIAKQSDNSLTQLKECFQCLLEPRSNNPVPVENVGMSKYTQNIFLYNERKYHVNYVDYMCKTNAKGETPLHIACKKGKLDDVNRLIENKCDLNAKDFAGWAPLHEAVQCGSMEIVEILLKNGVLIDIPGEKYITPLHKAVTLGHIQIIELLLNYNPSRNMIDYFGKKPLDYTLDEKIKEIFAKEVNCINRIEEVFCRTKINVYFYYIEEKYKQKLANSKFVKVIPEYDAKKVSHFLIRKTHKLSLKILIAMLEGCYLFPQEWVDEFLKNNYFISIPDYEFISKPDLNEGIKKAVFNSMLKLPKLFDGMFFFIQGHNSPINIHNLKLTKDSICSLVTSGGGKLLRRAPTPTICENIFNYPFHSNLNGNVSRCCHYIIYDENNPPVLKYQMGDIKHKSSKWLLDCVINFTIYP